MNPCAQYTYVVGEMPIFIILVYIITFVLFVGCAIDERTIL